MRPWNSKSKKLQVYLSLMITPFHKQNVHIFSHTMDSDNKPTETVPTDEKKQGKKRNYRKDKPWDDGTVNKWEIEVGMCVGLD